MPFLLANGISTFKVAVALAVGIALVLGLPCPAATPGSGNKL